MGRWGDGSQRAPGRASGARRRGAAGLGGRVARCRARRRRVPARAVLHGALRLLRLQHLHRERARRWREPGVVRGHPPDGGRAGPAGARRCRTGRSAGPDGVRRGRGAWGLAPGAEITTEANPDSVTPDSLVALARGGFTRVSFGMQSAVPHVLATLERTHDPSRVPEVVRWARDAGLDTSLDLIYGTPGESLDDWRRSVEAALDCGVDHVSAYALVIEPGTRMAAAVRRGVLPETDPDDQATKYELADEMLAAAGLPWYEVSNWARPGHACRHNLGYWRGADWWGFGPGAHSHVAAGDRAVRWWNVKHPRAYAQRLATGHSPAAARELLEPADVRLERVLLGVRLSEGLDLGALATPSSNPSATSPATASRPCTGGWCSPAGGGCSPTRWCGR